MNEKFTVGIAKVSSYQMRFFFAYFLSELCPVTESDVDEKYSENKTNENQFNV